jgi:crossover junction endodeoxyribonuclease RuvC
VAVEAGGVAVIRVLGLDLKPARSGIAQNYDSDTGVPRLSVTAVGAGGITDLHAQVRVLERAILVRVSKPGIRPDVAFIEGTFSRPGGSGSDYGQHAAHFAVTHLLHHFGVPWVDVSPGKLKVWATGSGALRGPNKVTKDKVIAAVIATYGRFMNIPALDDEADAVALMTFGSAHQGEPLVDLTAAHTRALKEVPAPSLRHR